jgi:hypothetical protein
MPSRICGRLWLKYSGEASILEVAKNNLVVISVAGIKLGRESLFGKRNLPARE